MKRFTITYTDYNGKVWLVGGIGGVDAISMKAAAQMFWNMWTSLRMPKSVTIEEVVQ